MKKQLTRILAMALVVATVMPTMASAEWMRTSTEGLKVELWTYREEGKAEPGFVPEKVTEMISEGKHVWEGIYDGGKTDSITVTTSYEEYLAAQAAKYGEARYAVVISGTTTEGWEIRQPLTFPVTGEGSYSTPSGSQRGFGLYVEPSIRNDDCIIPLP